MGRIVDQQKQNRQRRCSKTGDWRNTETAVKYTDEQTQAAITYEEFKNINGFRKANNNLQQYIDAGAQSTEDWRWRAAELAERGSFKTMMALLIVFNSIQIGVESYYHVPATAR